MRAPHTEISYTFMQAFADQNTEISNKTKEDNRCNIKKTN